MHSIACHKHNNVADSFTCCICPLTLHTNIDSQWNSPQYRLLWIQEKRHNFLTSMYIAA